MEYDKSSISPNMQLASIRHPVESDALDLGVLRNKVWRRAFKGLAPRAAFEALDQDHRISYWQRILDAAACKRTLVAAIQGRLIGMVTYGKARHPDFGNLPELQHLYVDPGFRSRGLGRRLLLDAARLIEREGWARGRSREGYVHRSWATLEIDKYTCHTSSSKRHFWAFGFRPRRRRRVRQVTGQCLCGDIKYTVTCKLRGIILCNCHQCRKTSGHHVAATSCEVSALQIDGDVTWFDSSDQARRGFCARCGSNLFWHLRDSPRISIFAGSINGDTGHEVVSQMHCETKGDYYSLPDVPQLP